MKARTAEGSAVLSCKEKSGGKTSLETPREIQETGKEAWLKCSSMHRETLDLKAKLFMLSGWCGQTQACSDRMKITSRWQLSHIVLGYLRDGEIAVTTGV